MADQAQAAGDDDAAEVVNWDEITLAGAELERLVIAAGDLEFLKNLAQDRLPTHAEVRLATGILRRLVIDGQLDRLWKSISAPRSRLMVEANEIDSALSKWPERWVHYAWTGGASVAGAHHHGLVMAGIPPEEIAKYSSVEEFSAKNPLPYTPEKKLLSLGDWLQSTAIAVRTNNRGIVRISRRNVIKYLSNRKGGVHFDPTRKLTPNSAKRNQETIVYALLDHGMLRVGHLSGPEYEAYSIARTLSESKWAGEIVKLAERLAPEDFYGDPTHLQIWIGRESGGGEWETFTIEPKTGK